MRTNVVVWTGDSITAGNHVSAGQDYPTLVATALGVTSTSHNIGVPSSTIDSAGQGASADVLYDNTKDVNICSVLFGANDMETEDGAAYVVSLKSFCLARRTTGFKVVVITCLPCNSYPENFARRAAANALIRADASFYDALADVGAEPTMGPDAATSDTTLYSDGVHPTYLGNQILAPVIAAALAPLLSVSSVAARSV